MLEGQFEVAGVGDLGDVGAARLFGGFQCDAAPAFGSLGGGEGEVFFGAAGEDGGDVGDAEFGGFLYGPFEVIEFEDGQEQVYWECGVGFQFFVEDEANFLIGNGGDFGAVEEAVGDYVEDLAGFGAKDASEVKGLIASKGGGGGTSGGGEEGVGDEAAASHRIRV